jgi:hypothetical protein
MNPMIEGLGEREKETRGERDKIGNVRNR